LDQIDLKDLTALNESRWHKPLQSQRAISSACANANWAWECSAAISSRGILSSRRGEEEHRSDANKGLEDGSDAHGHHRIVQFASCPKTFIRERKKDFY
ncbi:hypothetical protein, partial [Gluconobacter cerinus]